MKLSVVHNLYFMGYSKMIKYCPLEKQITIHE